MAKQIKNVVVGAAIMGHGIAQLLAMNGIQASKASSYDVDFVMG